MPIENVISKHITVASLTDTSEHLAAFSPHSWVYYRVIYSDGILEAFRERLNTYNLGYTPYFNEKY